ncbi:hypothetical protein NL108_008288 [Boleophthalmus pectinirostris]|nr:hypothetical protein NL108_008288 [Boleophthalmus pectinirostris]
MKWLFFDVNSHILFFCLAEIVRMKQNITPGIAIVFNGTCSTLMLTNFALRQTEFLSPFTVFQSVGKQNSLNGGLPLHRSDSLLQLWSSQTSEAHFPLLRHPTTP